jgi:hypothetical protein
MYSVDVRVGRLIEARFATLESVDEVARFEDTLRATFARVAGKSVICADWRSANVLSPAVADRLLALLSRGNPHLERSAVLFGQKNATFILQAERLVREAGNPARRTFREVAPLQSWLDEVLSPVEQLRMRDFLTGAPL